jgi:hypothetical protein
MICYNAELYAAEGVLFRSIGVNLNRYILRFYAFLVHKINCNLGNQISNLI